LQPEKKLMAELTPIELQLQTLPLEPGVYQFYDKADTLIYVGKAVSLKKRVSSYFVKNHSSVKTRMLVQKIARIEHIVVKSETDALLLENNLIKQYQPRYNILLKDDKSYPWICVKKERFPRVFYTRRMVKDGSLYFGPYTNVKAVRALLDLIRELYPLRTCTYDLSEENIRAGKFKVCLEYHLKNCKGPCEGLQTEADYNANIEEIVQILKGNYKEALAHFKSEMMALAGELRFEEAQRVKHKVEVLENYQARSTIVSAKVTNVDVLSIVSDEEYAYVNFLQVVYGAVVRAHTIEIKKRLEETDAELLEYALLDLREREFATSKEVVVPFVITLPEGLTLTVPKSGEKAKLLELSLRNAKQYRAERFKQEKIVDPERHTNRILTQMQRDLHLSVPPAHIECFDNSNIQGTNPVSACVVFKNAKPSKKDYRHFNVKTVEGPNDFASMEEAVFRRYRRLLDEEQPLPQLIIIDGGKGQLSSALKALEALELRGKIAIVGIAKRLEEIYFPEDPIPLYLDKRSETLRVIQQLRDEAHRFGITFHRQKRSKAAIVSELSAIEGIGEKTQETLLRHFKSVKRIKEASLEEITATVGNHKAKKVWEYFHNR
jgi:excinuclease ABC, C subunit